jgi:hypothetical protein
MRENKLIRLGFLRLPSLPTHSKDHRAYHRWVWNVCHLIPQSSSREAPLILQLRTRSFLHYHQSTRSCGESQNRASRAGLAVCVDTI